MELLIKPGHYQTKSSIGSDRPDIIRILGADNSKPDNWITQDGKSIPSYIIEEDYVALDTAATQEDIKRKTKTKKNLFADFEKVDENKINYELGTNGVTINSNDNNNNNEPQLDGDYDIIFDPNLSTNSKLTHIGDSVHTQAKKIEVPFDISIIDKTNIDKLNKKSMDKFGIDKYKKPILDLLLEIEFNYDIQRLKTSIELFDLDIEVILDYLVTDIMKTNFKPMIKEKLRQKFTEEPPTETKEKIVSDSLPYIPKSAVETKQEIEEITNFKEVESQFKEKLSEKTITKQNENQTEIKTPDNWGKLSEGISEVDNYLKNMF